MTEVSHMFINYLLIAAGCITQAFFIKTEHEENYKTAVFQKGLASLMFVLIGILAWVQNGEQPIIRTIVIGLIFGMAGDILLNLRFVYPENGKKIFLTGILAFLIGHILYLKAIIPLSDGTMVPTVIGALIAAVLLAYIFKTMEVNNAYKIFGVFYLGAVIIMTCIAYSNALAVPDAFRVTYAIGAVFFTLSDIVLIFNTFGKTTKFSLRITNLSLYYIGQVMIALSLHFLL